MAKFNGIVALNVNSLLGSNRKQLFTDFVSDVRADIYLLSETCLTTNSSFNLVGYNCFKQTRKSNGGGTAIIINDKIKFRNFTTICDGMEATILDVHLDEQWIKIISVYIPPRLDKFNHTIFSNIFNTNTPIICGGDFNARMLLAGDSINNSIGIHITRFLQNNHINPIFPKSPTCYRTTNGSFIDFFLVSPSLDITADAISTHPSFSDHLAIKLDISFNHWTIPIEM